MPDKIRMSAPTYQATGSAATEEGAIQIVGAPEPPHLPFRLRQGYGGQVGRPLPLRLRRWGRGVG
jgi:hypothetical protein